jgi:hypothetical protein
MQEYSFDITSTVGAHVKGIKIVILQKDILTPFT